MRPGWLVVLCALCSCQQLFGVLGAPGNDAGGDAGPLPREWLQVTAGDAMTCAIAMDQSLWCWGYSADGETGTASTSDIVLPTRVGAATWLQVDAGPSSVCGIQTDHSLWCWGDGDYSNLGLGSTTGETSPTQVGGKWLQISVSLQHTCGIADDNTLLCWGYNADYELGDGSTNLEALPEQIGTSKWTAVGTGQFHTCAIAQADNTMWCWGSGDVGVMAPSPVEKPMQVTTSDAFSAVSSGYEITCALTTNNQLRCWGDDFNGRTPTAVIIDGADATDWTSLSSRWTHVCATRADGSLWCFGDDATSELGFDLTGGQATVTAATQVTGGGESLWTSVATGVTHTCAIDSQLQLWCVGSDGLGELGDGGTSHRTPTAIPGSWANASAGTEGTCAVDMSGNLACTGLGTNGQIGDGNAISRKTMTPVGSGWLTASTGREDRCAVANDGTVACWGLNSWDELSNDATELDVPTQIAVPEGPGAGMVAIASGDQTCAIASDGTLYCWGQNSKGQIGIGDGVDQTVDTPTEVLAYTTAVATGVGFTCAIAGGITYCFGDNSYGELGDDMSGEETSSAIPVPIEGQYIGLTAGAGHACAWEPGGDAYCWGDNNSGDLGLGNTTQADSPQQLPMSWVQLSAGDTFTCGIATDGTLWCWGANGAGQLGNGGTLDADSPVQVGTASNWQSVTAGNQHACAIDDTDTMYCWGLNENGQLGDGTAWTSTLTQVH